MRITHDYNMSLFVNKIKYLGKIILKKRKNMTKIYK